MSKNLKDKRIELFRCVNNGALNDIGDHNHEWKSCGKYWAYTRMISMKEFNDYGLGKDDIDRLFIVNYNKDITSNDRIIYREQEYEIYSIDTLDDNKQDMKIYARNIVPRRIH